MHFDSRRNEDMWVRIFYKGSKYKGAVKAVFCEIESNDLMWHDFFWIKHYGAKKPVPEKLARKAKRVGFAQPGEWRHGVRISLGERKGKCRSIGILLWGTRKVSLIWGTRQGQIVVGIQSPRGFFTTIYYVNHYGQVHRVIFMFVALQR